MEQRTPEWYAARLGKVTASRVADVMAKTKTGYSASRNNYMAQLICERLTGKPTDTFSNAAMQRGTGLEPMARSFYEVKNDLLVIESGLVVHPEIESFGASPDGLVEVVGLVEIKCPNTWTHIETLKSGKPKSEYITQMQAQMACTGRAWCDFVSFDDRLPDDLAYFQTRIERDEKFIETMLQEIRIFLGEMEKTIQQLVMRKAA